MKKLDKNNFKDWKDYYQAYQKSLAEDYYIPFLLNSNIEINDRDILEIGCGNGGFIEGFSSHSDKCVGFDLKNLNWETDKVKFYSLDVFDEKLSEKIDSRFDLIILRDVVEHLDNKKMDILFDQIKLLLKDDGAVLITFPPFYSPFGLHQQVLLNSFLKYIPYLSLLPKLITRILTSGKKHNKSNVDELLSLYESKKTIYSFHRLVNRKKYSITHKKFFHIRPSHEIRYGLKTMESNIISKIPVIRELFVTGTIFLIKK